MKAGLMAIAAIGFAGAQALAEDAVELKTDKDKTSYSIGADIGKNLKNQGIELDAEKFARGLKDAQMGAKLAMTDEEMRAAIMAMQQEAMKNRSRIAAEKGAANQKEGEEFLKKNKAEKDVVTLPSGLQYKILKAGEGKKPTETDTVECNYKGTLINGTEFDSSYKRGQPAMFPVGGVIKGWQEALQLMPVGSKWQLFVPSDLAYGPGGMGRDIGPNATLIFEVELLSIKQSESQQPEVKTQK